MNPFDFPPIAAALDAAYSLLTGLAGALAAIAPSWGAVLAIVLTTLAVRTVLIPIGVTQVRAQLSRARLAPALAALQRRYRKTPERLQRETLALYKREGVSPFAGMLPALAQIPLVSLVYALFTLPVVGGHANELLAQTMLGVALQDSWMSVLASSTAWPSALVGLGILLILAVVAWFSRRQVLRTSPPATEPRLASVAKFGASLSFITVVIGAFIPLAAAVYLVVSTAWTLGERAVVRRVLVARQVA
jgi:YidC/Oxa1 family membrane protein insertase